MKLKCLIIDDEPMARKGIEENIEDLDYLELIGTAENAIEANKLLHSNTIDLVFLDINMPKISGIDFLKNLKTRPIIIIISAYSEYAVESFDLDVLDYLVKPVAYDRFVKAVQKAKEFFDLKTNSTSERKTNYFFIKSENKYEKILYNDILFIEACDNYLFIHTNKKKYLAYITLKIIEDNLPKADFIKVHKSYIVSIQNIKAVGASELIIEQFKIPISRNLKDEVMKKIVNKNLFKR